MKRKIAVVWLSLMIVLGFIVVVDTAMDFIPRVKGDILYVNTTGGVGVYTKIQDAINDSKDGDTVFVYFGIYYENVVIDKTINLTGENRNLTIIDGLGGLETVRIEANWVNITGFTIKNGTYGISFQSSINNNISDNHVISNGINIYLKSSNNSVIMWNNVTSSSNDGIQLDSSSNIVIVANTIHLNNRFGIILISSSLNNTITKNDISDNEEGISLSSDCDYNKLNENDIYLNNLYGIHILSSNNSMVNNNITNNLWGIWLHTSSKNNTINENRIYSNINDGIVLWQSSRNNISNNDLIHNYNGIILTSSNNNTMIDNQISSNDVFGFELVSSLNNTIIHNLVHNHSSAIRLEDSDENTLSNNSFCSNEHNGIVFTSSSDWNKITRCNIFSNDNNGIAIVDSSNNTIHHNNIMNNMLQVFLKTSTSFDNKWDDGNGEGNFWGDYRGLDDGSGGRMAGDGVGDTEIPHPYVDKGNGYYQLDNYPLMAPFGNYILLYEGWNLISIPYIQPETNLSTVLSSITGDYDTVWWYNTSDNSDNWKVNNTSKPLNLNDLNSLDHEMGFWIHVTDPGGLLFEYQGTQPTENQTIQLYPGWNMVGYPSTTNYNRTEGLNNITFGTHVDSIWTFNASSQGWQELGDMDYFEVGKGYWIHAKTKCEWEVPL